NSSDSSSVSSVSSSFSSSETSSLFCSDDSTDSTSFSSVSAPQAPKTSTNEAITIKIKFFTLPTSFLYILNYLYHDFFKIYFIKYFKQTFPIFLHLNIQFK